MWVSLVLGFDDDGQMVEKWREAFQRRGALVGEFSQREEYVEKMRRHTKVARLRSEGRDLLPPLINAETVVAEGRVWNVAGIAQYEPFNKWRAQAWRMEIISLDGPPAQCNYMMTKD